MLQEPHATTGIANALWISPVGGRLSDVGILDQFEARHQTGRVRGAPSTDVRVRLTTARWESRGRSAIERKDAG